MLMCLMHLESYVKIGVVLITWLLPAIVSEGPKFTCKFKLLLNDKDYPCCDKFEYIPCNINVIGSWFDLRRQFIDSCISQNKAYTCTSESKSSSPPKVRKDPVSPKSKSVNVDAGKN